MSTGEGQSGDRRNETLETRVPFNIWLLNDNSKLPILQHGYSRSRVRRPCFFFYRFHSGIVGEIVLTDKKESWFDVIPSIRDFNPLAFLVCFVGIYVFISTLQSNMPLSEKLTLLFLSGTIYVITVFFEVYRIQRNQSEQEGVIWRKQGE